MKCARVCVLLALPGVATVLLCVTTSCIPVAGSEELSTESVRTERPLAVYLTRFAARYLYAPARLRLRDARLRLASSGHEDFDCSLVQGVNWSYRSLGAWYGYGYWVEAVLVRNRSSFRYALDPRLLDHGRVRGDWVATTFQHRWLEPADSAANTHSSVLYLVGRERYRDQCADGGIRERR